MFNIFFNEFTNLMKDKCNHCDRLRLNSTLVLFGHDEHNKTDACFDGILLRAKFFIYKCRMNSIRPSIQHFNNELKYIYKVDKHIHRLEMNEDKFYRKWLLYTNMIEWKKRVNGKCVLKYSWMHLEKENCQV